MNFKKEGKFQKYCDNKIICWIALIVFAPLGFVMTAKNKTFRKIPRAIILFIFAFVSIYEILYMVSYEGNKITSGINNKSSQSSTAQTSTSEAKPKEQAKEQSKPAFDFSSAEINKDNVKKAASKVFNSSKITNINITENNGLYSVDLTYRIETSWDEKALVQESAQNAVDLMQILFKNPAISEVRYWTETSMEDAKGNTSEQQVVNFGMTKENAKDIKWDNFKQLVLESYKNLIKVTDKYYIAPGILKELK